MAGVYRSYGQFVLVLFGVAVLLMAPGFWMSRKLGGAEAVAGMLWGCGLSFFAAMIGGLPQLMGGDGPQQAGISVLASLAIRMGITLLGVLAILLSSEISPAAFLLWVAASYLVFLIVDVGFVLARARAS
jgi:hypothetical protein